MNPTIAQRLLRHAADRPDRAAIVTAERSWTWRDLETEVDLAATDAPLADLPPGAAIGWLGVNSVAMLACLLSCSRLGLRFVPLNWRLSKPELVSIVEDAGVELLYSDEAFQSLAGWSIASDDLVRSQDHPDDLLLVHTSGTTGEPKGAIHTQAAMLANIDAAIEAQAFDEATRCLAVLPMFHVGGLCVQLLPVLAAGGVAKLHARFDPGAWLDDVERWRPTTSLMVPATMRAVIEHPRWKAADLSSLRFITAGSSIVPLPLIEAFQARGVPVAQVYGATETGPVSIVLRPDEAMAHAGSVGRPARGVEVRLVGADGVDRIDAGSVLRGTDDVGEVWLRAPNLARGYHRRPNDAAFAGGWFRTGDLARRDAQGRFTIVGRSNEMIISGGENIYPAEIENLALADPAVADAAVIGMPDARWGEVPVLAVAPRPTLAIDLARLHACFDASLARYKHPRRIVVLPELPKTALGKVARAGLVALLEINPQPIATADPKKEP
jgi:fatty-acyl-CoA synthase